MLPSLGFSELVLLGILALVVVGPKDLPLMLRKLGRWTAKLRGMAQEFRTGFDELARQAELDELKKEVDALRRATSDIGHDMQRELTRPVSLDSPKLSSLPAPNPTPTPSTEADIPPPPPEAPQEAPPAAEVVGDVVDESPARDDAPLARSAP